MNPDAPGPRLVRGLIAAVLIVGIMWLASELLKPIVVAVLFSFLLAPLVRIFDRRGLPRVASIAITLLLVFGAIGLGSFFVTRQFMSLADQLPTYEENIIRKVAALRPNPDSAFEKAARVAEHVNETLAPDELAEKTPEVRIVRESSFIESIRVFLDPFKEIVAWAAAVLLLLVFLLLYLEDIGDRIVQLAGHGHISLTSKTTTLIAKRLSKYFTAFSLFNLGFGAVIGLLMLILGVPYPFLWGTLAAVLRFIPYLGPVTAFTLPVVFSFAHDPGWMKPILVILAYGVIEIIANSIEPIVYGRTIGVSSLGLLVSAMFWTWLWGGLGLFLATPLTVCLVVLGRYAPGLQFLDTLLREKVHLEDDLRFYQRLHSRDQDGAVAVLEQAMEQKSFGEVCDQIVIPALSRTDRDRARGALDLRDVVFHWRVIQQWLDEIEQSSDAVAAAPEAGVPALDGEPGVRAVGVAPNGMADVLILRMLALLLRSSSIQLQIVEALGPTLNSAQQISDLKPDLILVSHLPPNGLAQTRYLIRRIRAAKPDTPLLVGYWDQTAALSEIQEQLHSLSVYHVVLGVVPASVRLQSIHSPREETRLTADATGRAAISGITSAPLS